MKVEEHYMFKEAVEGPSVVRRTLSECRGEVEAVADALRRAEVRRGFIVGSGTSFHASLYLQYLINKYTDLHFTAVPASEFKAWKPVKGRYVVIGFSQSGESSDVIEAVKEAKAAGVLTIGITNTPGSTLTKLADYSVVTRAGEEKAVTATKTFDVQLAASLMIVRAVAGGGLDDLMEAVKAAEQVIEARGRLRELASGLKSSESVYVLGRGATYPIALEFALKLKEAAMIHAEGFAVREFLHGPLQLVDEGTPVYLLLGSGEAFRESEVALKKIQGYKPAWVYVGPRAEGVEAYFKGSEVEFEGVEGDAAVLPVVKAAQLIAYYASVARGLNPDKPTKLTKVVKYESQTG
ncbi:MAG: hypothetical protein DRJ67_04880 [Thermoprotei archaeon]|nr:MAG: hypothetical protein DRJ67_04880 [Thermoprotei archaeon]